MLLPLALKSPRVCHARMLPFGCAGKAPPVGAGWTTLPDLEVAMPFASIVKSSGEIQTRYMVFAASPLSPTGFCSVSCNCEPDGMIDAPVIIGESSPGSFSSGGSIVNEIFPLLFF